MQITLHLIFERQGSEIVGRCLELPEASGKATKIDECKEVLWNSITTCLKEREQAARLNLPSDAIEVELHLK